MFAINSISKKILKISTLVVFVLGIITTAVTIAVRQSDQEVNAVSADDTPVVITAGPWMEYGIVGHGTKRYYATTSDNVEHQGYCANPWLSGPELDPHVVQTPDYGTANNNAIRLLVYISTISNSHNSSLMRSLFGWASSSTSGEVNISENMVYSMVHATIGAINDDYTGLEGWEIDGVSVITRIDNTITAVRQLINNNDSAFTESKNYKLLGINQVLNQQSGKLNQNVVWIEALTVYGSIKVKKCDAETRACAAQGNASLEGIKFEASNGNNRYEATTNESGVATFSNLPNGTYTVKEINSNTSYNLDTSSGSGQTTAISISGEVKELTFYDTVKKGKLTVSKKDAELDTCSKLGSATFAGNKFQVVNKSTNSIYYGGSTIAVNAVVTTKTMSAEDCSVVFDNLPYGSYTLKETAVGNGYILNGGEQSFSIPTNDSYNISKTISNQVIRGDVKFKKVDKNNNNAAMANVPFRITSKTTGENHIVVTNANGEVDTSAIRHTLHTNGYDSLTTEQLFNVTYHNDYGTWFGTGTTANDNLGALPYDTYEVVELSCDSNKFCYDINAEKQTFSITSDKQKVDLGTWENDCTVFELSTTATDQKDGDKFVVAGSDTVIVDNIRYVATANMTFIVKGILMDKATNSPLLVNGNKVESSIEVTPSSREEAWAQMTFNLDTTYLAGKEIVVFERMYYGDELVIEHAEINDANQTIDIVSLSTLATDDSDGDHIIFDEQEAKIRDVVDYCLIPGKTYTIKSVIMDSKNGLPIKINGEKIEASTEITPTKNCDYVELYFDVDPSEIAGRNIVMFEDLYYNDHLVLEHNTLFDKYETINVLSLSTTATDLEDGDKLMAANKQVTITDKVDYCLLEDETFTIKGVVMNKTTKEILLINGAPVEQTITITPEEKCGSVNMEYTLDTTGLGGSELIIFESLYYDNERLIAHEDYENASETVSVLVPTPDTGLFTKADWEDREEQIAPVISIVAVALPATFLIIGFGIRKMHSRHHVKFN
ncbi:MAG: VaFE repeat-containing surface-anchored protein [Candidatus Saccharibacteria bacterium]|nr:VaFE repeat-containing surface-anchored protein [Candidatus Saccharibacteria bacterium]